DRITGTERALLLDRRAGQRHVGRPGRRRQSDTRAPRVLATASPRPSTGGGDQQEREQGRAEHGEPIQARPPPNPVAWAPQRPSKATRLVSIIVATSRKMSSTPRSNVFTTVSPQPFP